MDIMVIHHNDSDGMLSAAILARHTGVLDPEKYIRIDEYGQPLDYDKFDNKEAVYILDYSVTVDQMDEIKKRCDNVIWIDHYDSGVFYKQPISGIRYYSKDKPKSGCRLVWEYLYPEKEVPLIISCISDYDTWNKESGLFELGYNVNSCLQYTLMPEVTVYRELLIKSIHSPECVEELGKTGMLVETFKNVESANLVLTNSFEWEYDGYKFLCLNTTNKSSSVFGNKIKEYDGCIVFYYKSGKYYYSVYASDESPLIANVFCKKFGGGGHAKAAGFSLSYNILGVETK